MLDEARRRVRDFLAVRRLAYRRVFKSGEDSRRVLLDLAKFCRAHETTVGENERATLVLEGRREVWLRIQQHINLTDEELWKLYMRGE